jgi:hypothetical protein
MIDYSLTPGQAGTAPAQFPSGIMSLPDSDRPTLMLFVHPRCPCSSATLVELNHILTACPGAADVRVIFWTPENPTIQWTKTALWDDAVALPDTTAVADAGGAMARQFDVKTSGHVLLYSAEGKLLFSGGITGARGEQGANRGRSAVVALMQGERGIEPESQVFGCPLFDLSAACESNEKCRTP